MLIAAGQVVLTKLKHYDNLITVGHSTNDCQPKLPIEIIRNSSSLAT